LDYRKNLEKELSLDAFKAFEDSHLALRGWDGCEDYRKTFIRDMGKFPSLFLVYYDLSRVPYRSDEEIMKMSSFPTRPEIAGGFLETAENDYWIKGRHSDKTVIERAIDERERLALSILDEIRKFLK